MEILEFHQLLLRIKRLYNNFDVMKITKLQMQNYLNSFSWEFREIFFEKSKTFKFSCLNWIFKTPFFSTLEGFSILSRTWKNEYFKVFCGFENINSKIDDFKKEFVLGEVESKVSLHWKEFLELKNTEDINFDISSIINGTRELFEELIKPNSFIASSDISLTLSYKSFIVWNSEWNFSSDTNFYNTYFIKLIWEKNWNREEIYEKITWIDILYKINKDNIKNILDRAVNVLVNQLDWIPSPTWKIDVIIGNEAGWTIIHEAVWHWLEADLLNSSVYNGKLWQKVASELVTIVDNPTIVWERGFYNFDHEWNSSRNTILIENGILKSYLHNIKTAKKFWVKSTWHGRKETYKHKSLVRMWNTYLLPWKDKKEDLISRVKYWIYVSRMWWWQVNTTTWDFVFKVQNWYLIENWKLTKNVRWSTISWNWPEMLNEIYWICDDLNFFDGWTCGKWQSMPVSDGTPTILTKLKVSWVD